MLILGKKGIINFIEAIFVIIAIFIAFAVLFPGFSFKSRWQDAATILRGRDSIITMDRLNILYQNSFNPTLLQNFVDEAIRTNRTNLIASSEVDGTIKSTITVACNCSDGQIENLTYWMSGMTMNGRQINFLFPKTTLENIIPSDALLIWGNINLDPHLASMLNYLQTGSGIVEINDFTSASDTGTTQQKIFGLVWVNQSDGHNFNKQAVADHFSRKPGNSTDMIYFPYKYFFHIPLPLKAFETTNSIPTGGNPSPSCSFSIGHGNFTLNDTSYNFWICNPTTVYFDTHANGTADTAVNLGSNFILQNMSNSFTLDYINYPQISVSFNSPYEFKDFIGAWRPGIAPPCPQGKAWGQFYTDQVTVNDNNMARVIVNASFPGTQIPDLPAVIVNNTGGRTAWIADFTAIPNFNNNCLAIQSAGDDQKLLLASLLLWTSYKQKATVLSSNIQNEIMIPYVNVQNLDTYEVYTFNLGLAPAFGS